MSNSGCRLPRSSTYRLCHALPPREAGCRAQMEPLRDPLRMPDMLPGARHRMQSHWRSNAKASPLYRDGSLRRRSEFRSSRRVNQTYRAPRDAIHMSRCSLRSGWSALTPPRWSKEINDLRTPLSRTACPGIRPCRLRIPRQQSLPSRAAAALPRRADPLLGFVRTWTARSSLGSKDLWQSGIRHGGARSSHARRRLFGTC